MKSPLFTSGGYRENLSRLLALPSLPSIFLEWGAGDFKGGDHEESVRLFRGPTAPFENSLHFFVNALRLWDAQNYREVSPLNDTFADYGDQAEFLPLSGAEFRAIIEAFTGHLKKPLVFVPNGPFLRATQTRHNWNDASAIAQYENEYVLFMWSTSA